MKKCENKKELCLYYHIGECLGYCSKDLNQNKVKEMEKEILSFLRGNDKILKNKIMDKIKIYSDNLNYEMAASLKEELNYINIVMEKQKIDLTDLKTRDVFGFYYKDGYMSVNVFYVRNGKLVGSKNDIYLCLDEEDACEYYIAEFYTKHEIPNNVLVSSNLNKKVLEKDKQNYQEATEALYDKQIEIVDQELSNTSNAQIEAQAKMNEAKANEASAKAAYEAEESPEAKKIGRASCRERV